MTMHAKVGGVWKDITPSVKVGTVWKAVQEGWVKVGGVWKQFYSAISATLDTAYNVSNTSIQPADSYAAFRVSSDGYVYTGKGSPTITYTQSTKWISTGAVNTDYECRWTNTSGTLSAGTAGTWQSLGSVVQFTRNNTSNTASTQTCIGTLEIRMSAAPNTVLASTTVTLEAIVEL